MPLPFSRTSKRLRFHVLTFIATLLILLASCSGPTARVTKVTIVTNVTTMVAGTTTLLDVEVQGSGGASLDVAWTSSNPTVATIDAEGLVRALAEGATVITATSVLDVSQSDSVTISVTPAPAVGSVTIDPSGGLVLEGNTLPLTATVASEGGATETVTWSSSDEAVATVDDAGVVTGLRSGTASITAASEFDPSQRDVVEVSVVPLWESQFGTPEYDADSDVIFDSQGRLILVGHTRGSLAAPHLGSDDAYVRMFEADGRLAWEDQFGTADSDVAYGVAVDAANRIIVTGHVSGPVMGRHVGLEDVFVRIYTPDGDVAWEDQFGSNETDDPWAVAVDDEGRIVVVGATDGNLFDGLSGVDTWDAFVRVYAADGSVAWEDQFGTTGDDKAYDVSFDGKGRVVVVGESDGALAGRNRGDSDGFIRVYTRDGDVAWEDQVGTELRDDAYGVTVDASNRIVVVGYTEGSLFGSSLGSDDAWVRVYESDGRVAWERQFGTQDTDYAYLVAIDALQRIVITGDTTGDLAGPNAGNYDGYVLAYTPGGQVAWKSQFGTEGDDFAYGIAIDGAGRIAITGHTEGDLIDRNASDELDVVVRLLSPDGGLPSSR